MTTDKNKFKKEMEASQYFMNKNAKSMFDVIDMCEYYKTEQKAVRQTNRSEAGNFANLLNQEMEELKNSMKDKENQIKKMAQLIADSCTIHKVYVNKHYPDRQKDMYYSLAEELLKHYQPKLSEDSVVISKEEYEKLQSDMRRLAYQNCNLKIENKNLEENLEIEILKSKEMAERGLNKVREMLNNCQTVYEDDKYLITPNVGYLMKDVDDGLDKIEKEFNIEIKE